MIPKLTPEEVAQHVDMLLNSRSGSRRRSLLDIVTTSIALNGAPASIADLVLNICAESEEYHVFGPSVGASASDEARWSYREKVAKSGDWMSLVSFAKGMRVPPIRNEIVLIGHALSRKTDLSIEETASVFALAHGCKEMFVLDLGRIDRQLAIHK